MSRVWMVLILFGGCAPDVAEAPASRSDETAAQPASAPETPPPPALPGGPWDEALTLEDAAFDTPGPSVLVHAPPGFDPAVPLELVVFLHGWSGCARVLALDGQVACVEEGGGEAGRAQAGWALNRAFDETGSRALFLVPQLAWRARDGAAGRFAESGGFQRFLSSVLTALAHRLGEATPTRLTLLPHSAGFETALAIVQRGGVEVNDVVLFDALYRGVPPFVAWAGGAPDRRLVSLYTGSARTASQSRRLSALASSELGREAVATDLDAPLAEQVCAHRVVVARARAPHADVPSRHLREVMEGLASAPTAVCSETP